jgi:hypothetical protein
MRWTRAALLTRAPASRTAKSCGPDASTAASSRRNSFPQATVTIKPDHRGEHEVTVKPSCVGMPGYSGVTAVTNSCGLFFSHARLRVHWAPGIPHALCRARDSCTTRAKTRRGIVEVCLSSLRGAERRSNPSLLCRAMDCFAEPVIGRRFAPTRWLAMTFSVLAV